MGSIVSQGIGVATGIQDKFSWKAVGLSALTAFLGPVPVGKIAGSAFLGNAVGGALTSAAVQGIAVATGLQDKFSWAGVAAAGIGAGVGGAVGSAFKTPTDGFGALGQDLAVSTASTLANAATRSAIEGSNFGDNLAAALPDAIGGGLGRALGRAAQGQGRGDTPENLLAGTPYDERNPTGRVATTTGQRATSSITEAIPSGAMGGPLEENTVIHGARGDLTISTEGTDPWADVILYYAEDPDGLNDAVKKYSADLTDNESVAADLLSRRLVEEYENGIINLDKFQKVGNSIEKYWADQSSLRGVEILMDRPYLDLLTAEFRSKSISVDGYYGWNDLRNPKNHDIIIIAKGDSLSKIGLSRKGLSVEFLSEINGISNPDRILIGRELIIPTQGYIDGVNSLPGRLAMMEARYASVESERQPFFYGEFMVDNHGNMPLPRLGRESHHGALSAWMATHYEQYDPNRAPAVLMPAAAHNATRGAYNTWRAEQRAALGGTFDWKRVPEADMRALSDRMFDAAKTPQPVRTDYWSRYESMMRKLRK